MTTIEHRLPADYRAASLRADALAGLTATPKSLPPKWFYDAQGSALFEKITELPEYYPTRAERAILRAVAPEIAALTGAATLVELGSGSSEKTRLLLSALRDAGTLRGYVPVDVSESALAAAGRRPGRRVPGARGPRGRRRLREVPGRAVGRGRRDHGGGDDGGPRLVAFLGSTIGNMVPAERAVFLRRVRAQLRPGDAFLLGTDLVKDPAVLVAAYDDSAGVTAAFNKNVLAVLNAELGADFDLDAFDHVAVWDAEREWIEMRLRAASAQSVRVARPRPDGGVRGRRGDAHRGVGQVPRGRGARRAGRGGAGDAVLVDRPRRPVRPVARRSRLAGRGYARPADQYASARQRRDSQPQPDTCDLSRSRLPIVTSRLLSRRLALCGWPSEIARMPPRVEHSRHDRGPESGTRPDS